MQEFIKSPDSITETIGQGVQVGLAADRLEGLANHRRFEGLGDKLKVKKGDSKVQGREWARKVGGVGWKR